MRKKQLNDNAALKTIDYILGDKTKSNFSLPVDLRVGITPELQKTVLTFAGLFAGAIIINAIIKHSKK